VSWATSSVWICASVQLVVQVAGVMVYSPAYVPRVSVWFDPALPSCPSNPTVSYSVSQST
jgi:hypothetical protein